MFGWFRSLWRWWHARRSGGVAARLARRARRVADALRYNAAARLPADAPEDLAELLRPADPLDAALRYLAYRRAGGAWLAEAMPLAEALARLGLTQPALVPLYLEYVLGSPAAPERRTVEAVLARAVANPAVSADLRALAAGPRP